MINHVEKLLIELESAYFQLCGGDLVSAITYDFEVYSIAQNVRS